MGRQQPHTVRIIGGQWRGSKLSVVDTQELRPTLDRLRETVFNWLQPFIAGSRCLDAFAGSGALGFEAASRGAASVVMLESSAKVHANLLAQAERLQATQLDIQHKRAENFLANNGEPFDIVFLDPPFASPLLSTACELLTDNGWLKSGAHIYLETQSIDGFSPLPAGWQFTHQKKTAGVCYGLANFRQTTAE